jgi:type IV pilus assembly protein PilX
LIAMSSRLHPVPAREHGIVMISALLLLIVATILALMMFRGFGLEEKVAANVRDKGRALQAAQSAEQYAEWWMLNGSPPAPLTCSEVVASSVGQVCSNAPASVTTVPWGAGVSYLPLDPSTGTAMPLNGTSGPGVGTYFGSPVYYVTDLGPGHGGEVYQIDALGYGGTQNTVAIVESTYVITSGGGKCADVICP